MVKDSILYEAGCRERSYCAGELIDCMPFTSEMYGQLAAGSIELTVFDSVQKVIARQSLEKGNFLGISRLFTQKKYPLKLSAKSNCTVLELPVQDFMNILHQHPNYSERFCRKIMDNLRNVLSKKERGNDGFGYTTYYDCI